jgi:hypothetical protein
MGDDAATVQHDTITECADNEAVAAVDEPRSYSEAQVQEIVRDRLKKLKGQTAAQAKELADLRAKLEAQDRARSDATLDTEPDADGKPPKDGADDPNRKWREKLAAERKSWESEKLTLAQQLDAERSAHKATHIGHALLSELSKKPGVRQSEIGLALKLLRLEAAFERDDDGNVIAKVDDDEVALPKYLDRWLAEHPIFLTAPPAGAGQPAGGKPSPYARPRSERSEGEQYRRGAEELAAINRR